MKHGQCARCVELAAEVARLTPYVEAFRREETRADKLGTEVDDLREQLSVRAQGAPEAREKEITRLATIEECARVADAYGASIEAIAADIRALSAVTSTECGAKPLPIPTPAQIEPILDDFLGVDSPHYEELRRRCAQRIFDLCAVTSGLPIKPSDNKISSSAVSSTECGEGK